MRELVIKLQRAEQRPQLMSFLREQGANPRQLDQYSIALDLDGDHCPPLATLVATLDDWRARAHAGETVLDLDGETRILRTEI